MANEEERWWGLVFDLSVVLHGFNRHFSEGEFEIDVFLFYCLIYVFAFG